MNSIILKGREVFRSPIKFLSQETVDLKFSVRREDDVFVLDIDTSDPEFLPDKLTDTLSSYLEFKGEKFSHAEMDRLPHDLVLGLVSMETPRKLTDVHSRRYNLDDNKTPDHLTSEYCFELGTSSIGANYAYDSKKSKYHRLCSDNKLKNMILGVGPMEVVSNFNLSDDEVNIICRLYSLGKRIQIKASKLGFIVSKFEGDLEKSLKFSMKNVNDNYPKSFLNIEKDEWENWSKHLGENEFKLNNVNFKVYSDLTKKSVESVRTMLSEESKHSKGVKLDLALKENYENLVESFPTRPETDNKTFPIPFCAVENGKFEFDGSIDTNTPIGELWSSIKDTYSVTQIEQSYNTYENKIYDKKEEFDLRMSKEHRLDIKEKNRVKVSLTGKAKNDLAEKGYLGKKFCKAVKKENEQNSIGYSLRKNYDMTLFERFISNSELLQEWCPSEKIDKVSTLLGIGNFKLTDVPTKFVKNFHSTKLGSCLEFLSSLFSEINLNFRKPTKSNEFVVNVIPNYKALLAVHNTGSNKHTFYTVLVKKGDLTQFNSTRKIFKMWQDVGDYFALSLSSTRRHDISNYLFCSSKVTSMLATHMEVLGNKLQLTTNFRGSEEFFFHLLVFLENNNQVSETLQQVRYFYMKTNSSKLMPVPLLAPVEKLPSIIRTKFGCFAIKKLISSFLSMSMTRSKISHAVIEKEEETEEENFAEDFLKGVTSYISEKQLDNYEEVLLLSYGGIYHNKEKSDNVASNLQIYRKLTKEELKLKKEEVPQLKNGYEIENSMDMPPHGFSGVHLRNCGLALLEDLKKRGMSAGDLQQRIALGLNKVTYEELATFKSSLESSHLNIKSSDKDFSQAYPDLKFDSTCKTNKNKYKYGKTSRALEGVLDVLNNVQSEENTKPFHIISTLINLCNQRGGIVAILFKKAQFGSVREIFILTMFARIVVKFVETLSRTVAECLPNEYLTKGSSKVNSTPAHYNKVRSLKRHGDSTLSMFDSLDCKTWCQNFTFPAFGNLFSVIFKDWPEISEVIRSVFNMASSKRHEMTETLMTLFLKHQEIKSTSDSMNELKKEFLSQEGGQLNNGEQSIFVKNISNFMQGIFHYTSTVLHSAHLIMMTKIISKYIRRDEPVIKALVHTTKASSDDGSSLITVVLKNSTRRDQLRIRAKLFVASEMLYRSYPLACAWIGEPKSTRFVENGVEEFNSLWSFRNTVLSVPSKFTAAAVCPKITRSAIERMRVDHNSLNSCIENGCSMQLTKIIEVCCAMNHYIIMGLDSTSNANWSALTHNMQQVPHPASWLYINSPDIAGPTLGYDATLRDFLNSNSLARKLHYVVTELLSGTFDIKSGFLIQSSIIIGNLSKYTDFLNRIDVENNLLRLESKLDENPDILYRPSTSKSEVELKIYLKAKSSGAERAFIFEDESAMHSISSYLISSPSMTVSKKTDDGGNWDRKKMSLPAYLKILQNLCSNKEAVNNIEPHTETLLEMTKMYSLTTIPIGRRRRLPIKIRFPKTRSESEISLQSAAKFIWFSIFNDYDEAQNKSSFLEYKKIHSWLCDSYFETVEKLKSMGLEGNLHSTIQGMLMSESDIDRSVTFLHSGKKENTIISSYLSCIEYCQEKGCRLVRPKEIYSKTDLGKFSDVERRMFPYVSIHPKIRQIIDKDKTDALEMCKNIMKEHSGLFLKTRKEREIRFMPKRLKNLLTIGACYLKSDDKNEIENVLLNYSSGYIITYLKEQRRDEEGNWKGKGEFFVKTNTTSFIIECWDNVVTCVHSSNTNKLTQHLNILTKVFKVLKLDRDSQESISSEGIRISAHKVYYSTTKGTPVIPLTYSLDRRGVSYETDLQIKNSMNLELNVWAINKAGRFKAEPIRFRPSNSGNGDCRYKMDFNMAKNVLVAASNYEETNSVRKFCQESLLDRLARKKLLTRTKMKKLYFGSMLEQSEDDDEFAKDVDDWFNEASNMDEEELLMILNEGNPITDDMESVNSSREDVDLDELIDEVDLFAVVKDIDSQTCSFEDLIIWDEFIDRFHEVCRFNFSQILTGDYFLPADPKIQNIFQSLIKLKIIPPPALFSKIDTNDEFDFDE